MSNFKFPIGAKIARSLTDEPLLIVGRESKPTASGELAIYWTLDTSGVRDWQYADVVEAEFMEVS